MVTDNREQIIVNRGKKKPLALGSGLWIYSILCSLITVLCICSCDLFLNKPENDLLREIDEAIEYANAARLTAVAVAVPEGWGSSNPVPGTITSLDIRRGYAFTVEFTPGGAYGFAGWRAYRTGDLPGGWTANPETALDSVETAPGVVIEGGTTATVTINSTEPVTLVPWCEARPRITMSNPPLINTGISYSRGQTITVYFATALNADTVKFGQGFFEITGQTIPQTPGESSELYDDPATDGIHENGDLTGGQAGAAKFFYDPVYNAGAKTVTIRPGDGDEGTTLPPGNVAITVTVGTGVLNESGNGMISPVAISYRTDMTEVKKAWSASKIWGVHNPATANGEADFFYTGAAAARDRRLRKNGSGKYAVTLYFTVSKNSDEISGTPSHVKVVELHYANSAGGEVMSYDPVETPYTGAAFATAENSGAGLVFRQNNGGETAYYKITHELRAQTTPGIYRLIVIPWYDQDGDNDFSDAEDVAPKTKGEAFANGNYAAVVLDNLPPSGELSLSLSGAASTQADGGLTRYNYGRNNKALDFTANFSAVADNGGTGIRAEVATLDRPWTMDSFSSLEWQYQITDNSGTSYPASPAWTGMGVNSVTIDDLSGAIGSKNEVRDLKFRYRDGLGNESGWSAAARVYYYEDNLAAVGAWEAGYYREAATETLNEVSVSAAADSIAAVWTNPETNFQKVEAFYTVNGGVAVPLAVSGGTTAGGKGSLTISGVPAINDSGVLSGNGVTGVQCYEITLSAYNATNRIDRSFRIWNVPDMKVSNSNPAVEVVSSLPNPNPYNAILFSALPVGTASAGKNYVLTNDITLNGSWAPVGNTAAPFTGKFYGNGHTITVSGFTAAADMGLFGVVSGGLVRDITVAYNGVTVTGPASEARFGGIAGEAAGAARFVNVLTEGGLAFTVSGDNTVYAGGIAGRMTGTAKVSNACGGLALTVNGSTTPSTTTSTYVGGIAGSMGKGQAGGGAAVTIENVNAAGNITVSGNASSVPNSYEGLMVGGLAGMIWGANNSSRAVLENAVYRQGTITVTSVTGSALLGGAVGRIYEHANITNCAALAGGFDIEKTGAGTAFYVGGFLGDFYNTGTVSGCYSEGPVVVNTDAGATGSVVAGGFAGRIVAAISYCYAKGDVSALGYSTLYAGGFAGSIQNVDVSYCYAAGSVSAVSLGTVGITYVGGFAGGIRGASDCYALGDVFVNKSGTANINVGGFAGESYYSGEVIRCFAKGAVIAQRSVSGTIHIGGLVGNKNDRNLTNSAALGVSITVTGPGTGNTGRVFGDSTGGSITNNHAYNGMLIGESATYGAYVPGVPVTSGTGDTTKHGEDAHLGTFRSRGFWQTTLGFSDANWIFTTVEGRGYPILRGSANGPALGGQ